MVERTKESDVTNVMCVCWIFEGTANGRILRSWFIATLSPHLHGSIFFKKEFIYFHYTFSFRSGSDPGRTEIALRKAEIIDGSLHAVRGR